MIVCDRNNHKIVYVKIMKEIKTTCDYTFAPFMYKDRLSWYDINMSVDFSRQYTEIVVSMLFYGNGVLKLSNLFGNEFEYTAWVIGLLVFVLLAIV